MIKQDKIDWANSSEATLNQRMHQFKVDAELLGDAWRWFAVQGHGQTVMEWLDGELAKPCGCPVSPTHSTYLAGMADALKLIRNLMKTAGS